MLTAFEELSLNAWPSLQTVVYDGWMLRFAHGYTRRANSVNPLYVSTLEAEQKISFCENLYESKNLPVTFKMTGQVYPSDLDERLAAHGYQKDAPTSVQVLDLDFATLDEWPEVNLEGELSEEWLDHFCRMSSISAINRDTLRKILTSIVPRHCFASLQSEGQIAACGLGVLQAEYVGLFDIVTNAAYRRRGYGTQIVKTILAWGLQNSARHAYLQVMLNNAAALNLYSKLGFAEMYQYWYRVK